MNPPGETQAGYTDVPSEAAPFSGRLGRIARLAGRTAARLAFCASGVAIGAGAGGLCAFETPVHVELMPGFALTAQPMLGGTTEVEFGPLDQFPYENQLPPQILDSKIQSDQQNKPLGKAYVPKIHTKLNFLGIKTEVAAKLAISGKDINVAKFDYKSLAAFLADPTDTVQKPIVSGLVEHLKQYSIEGGVMGGLAFIGALALWEDRKSRITKDQENINTLNSQQRKAMLGLIIVMLAEFGLSYGIVQDSRVSVPTNNNPLVQEIAKQIPELQGTSFNNNSVLSTLNQLLTQAIAEQNKISAFYQKLDTNIINTMTPWLNSPATHANLYGPNTVVALGVGGEHCSYYSLTKTLPTVMSMTNTRLVFDTGNFGVSADSVPPMQQECATFAEEGLNTAEQATGHKITVYVAPGSHDSEEVLNKLSSFKQSQSFGGNNAFVILDGKMHPVDGLLIGGQATPRVNDYGQNTKIKLAEIPTAIRHQLGLPTNLQSQNETISAVSDKHNLQEIALYWSGEKLAKSCAANTDQKNIKVLITNSPEEEWQASFNGCSQFDLSGEGPAYDSNYVSPLSLNKVFQAVQISGGGNGADCNFWPDETIDKVGADYSVYSFNTKNHEISYANVHLNHDASVTISPWQDTSAAPVNQGNTEQFLTEQGDIHRERNAHPNPNAC